MRLKLNSCAFFTESVSDDLMLLLRTSDLMPSTDRFSDLGVAGTVVVLLMLSPFARLLSASIVLRDFCFLRTLGSGDVGASSWKISLENMSPDELPRSGIEDNMVHADRRRCCPQRMQQADQGQEGRGWAGSQVGSQVGSRASQPARQPGKERTIAVGSEQKSQEFFFAGEASVQVRKSWCGIRATASAHDSRLLPTSSSQKSNRRNGGKHTDSVWSTKRQDQWRSDHTVSHTTPSNPNTE